MSYRMEQLGVDEVVSERQPLFSEQKPQRLQMMNILITDSSIRRRNLYTLGFLLGQRLILL